MRRVALGLLMLAALASARCKSEKAQARDGGVLPCFGPVSEPTPPGCFAGTTTASPTLVIAHRTLDGGFEATRPGQDLPLVKPPQGGEVLLIGARARNIDGCPVCLQTSLRDECTNDLVALESRTVLMSLNADGWLEPRDPVELANYSNLAVCPHIGGTRNLRGETYTLRVTLTDRAGRTAESTVRIQPQCAEAAFLDQCQCECAKDYRLGEACVPDADAGRPSGACAPSPSTAGDDERDASLASDVHATSDAHAAWDAH